MYSEGFRNAVVHDGHSHDFFLVSLLEGPCHGCIRASVEKPPDVGKFKNHICHTRFAGKGC